MATYTFIASSTVGSGGASDVTFSSIPSTYTDLVIQVSARSTESDNASSLRCYYNGDATHSALELRGIGSAVASYTVAYAQAGYIAASLSTANTFGTSTIYIPNYANTSYNKSSSADTTQSSNTFAENYAVLSARLWSSTSAITSVTLKPALGSWVQYSTFQLYGIKNS
jgi:hypothetical protein